ICQYYPPEMGAPQARISEMAREWVRQGHDVTVLTGIPNHPNGIVPPEYRGKIFMEEEVEGVRVWRHWLYATPNRGMLKKTLSHISFMLSVVALSFFRGKRPDVIVVSSPNFFAAISAYVISRLRRAPFIFEVRDLWPGIFIELGVLKNRRIIRMLEMLELFLYRKAAAVVPVTKGFADDMVRRGIPREKIEVITNGADLERYGPAPVQREMRTGAGIPEESFLVMYMGAHGLSHGLRKIIDAAELLRSDKTVHFAFVGEGGEKYHIERIAKERNLGNVSFIPGQPKERVPSYYHMADVCLVPLKNIDGFSAFIPSKMFEIMGCGRPIIASLRGEPAEILSKSGSAVVIPPEDPESLVEAIMKLKNAPDECRRMGEAGRKFVEQHYDRRDLAAQYLRLMERIVCTQRQEVPSIGKGRTDRVGVSTHGNV
ncbi:MAG: glycosyltransferase family 4 protein, partial [bacterium]